MDYNSIYEFASKALNLKNIPELKNQSKKIASQVRLVLDNPDALHRSKIYSYRANKKIPMSLIEGIALGLIMSKEEPPASIKPSFFESSFDEYFLHTGLYFESINYSCHLSRNASNPSKLDADVNILYKGVKLHSYNEICPFIIQGSSDLSSINQIKESFKIIGSGVTVHPQERATVSTKDFRDKVVSQKIITKQKILFDSKSTKDTSLLHNIKTKQSYNLKVEKEDYEFEKSLLTLRKPTKHLSMEIHFDPNIFCQSKAFKVYPVCFPGHLTDNLKFVDSLQSSLDNHTLHQIGKRSWKWESSSPPLYGMKYGFIYNISEIEECIKGEQI